MKHLYEISAEIAAIADHFDEIMALSSDNGEQDAETDTTQKDLAALQTVLHACEIDRDKKALDIACLIKSLAAERDGIEAEIDRLKQRASSLERKEVWLKSYLSANIAGVKIKDARAVISWRPSKVVQEKVPAEKMPERFQRVTTTIGVNKTALREAIEAGDETAKLLGTIVTKQNLQIQ